MIKWIAIDEPAQCHQLFAHFDSLNPTWIVGDLRSKFLIQEKLLAKSGGFEDAQVYRANEFWQLLYKKIRPEKRIVSQDYLETFLKHGPLRDVFSEMTPAAVRTLFAELESYLPILFNPAGTDTIKEWFEDNPLSYQKWGGRLEYLGTIFNILRGQNLISRSWLAVALAQEIGFEQLVSQPLIVDLGADLSQSEVDILVAISRAKDVYVLVPEPSWQKDFSHLLAPYRYLEKKSFEKKIQAHDLLQGMGLTSRPDDKSEVPGQNLARFIKLSSQLAEVKHATSIVRSWLDRGISPTQIALVAPDIELYWPALSVYLQEEGVAANKATVIKYHSLPELGRWLSFLRVLNRNVSYADLEWGTIEKNKMKYSDFRSLFKTLIDAEDLLRENTVANLFDRAKVDLNKEIDALHFLAQAVSAFGSFDDVETLRQVADGFIQSCRGMPDMRFGAWFECLEKHLAQKERCLQGADCQGVRIVNLQSGDVIHSPFRIFLGQSEEQMRNPKKHQISSEEAFALAKDTDFYFEDSDQGNKGFDIRWVSSAPAEEQYFLYAMSDFEGSLQNPSLYFLENFLLQKTVNHEVPSVPASTRWDHIQSLEPSELSEFRVATRTMAKRKLEALAQEKKLDLEETLVLQKDWRFSPSSLETYGQCPFKFKVERVFNLYDPSPFDVDLDNRETGSIAHRIFERLITNQKVQAEVTDLELQKIVEAAIQELKPNWVKSPWYLGTVNKYVQIGKGFIKAEQEWFAQFPQARVIGMETPFEFYFNPQAQSFNFQPVEGAFQVIGKIDRIESDGQGNLGVVDYKPSKNNKSNYNKWFENQELQLGIYALALQRGFCQQMPSGEVVKATYYVYKDFTRDIGFLVAEADGQLFNIGAKKAAKMSLAQRNELLQKIEVQIVSMIQSILAGKFPAVPINPEKTCNICNWGKICRAPHLL